MSATTTFAPCAPAMTAIALPMPEAAPVTTIDFPSNLPVIVGHLPFVSFSSLNLAGLVEDRCPLFAMRGDALLDFRPSQPEHLVSHGCIERRPRHAEPVVERVLGPADRARRSVRKARGHFQRLGVKLFVVH